MLDPGLDVVLHDLQCDWLEGQSALPGQPAAALHLHQTRADRHPSVCPGVRCSSKKQRTWTVINSAPTLFKKQVNYEKIFDLKTSVERHQLTFLQMNHFFVFQWLKLCLLNLSHTVLTWNATCRVNSLHSPGIFSWGRVLFPGIVRSTQAAGPCWAGIGQTKRLTSSIRKLQCIY